MIDGEYFGVAYEDPELKKGPIYPAIALLSEGGVTINSTAKIPKEFGVQITGVSNTNDSNTVSYNNYVPFSNNEILIA